MLKEILKEKKCFKIICGAGNEDVEAIQRLIAVYAAVGANLFDISADREVFEGAVEILQKTGVKTPNLCVSIGLSGDSHVKKAVINSEICKKCFKCIDICPQKAVFKEDEIIKIDKKRCVGCKKCFEICKNRAVEISEEVKPFEESISSFLNDKTSCIELHSDGKNREELIQKWKFLNENYEGMLSLCIGGSKIGKNDYAEIVKEAVSIRKPFTTVIQADGNSISGFDDKIETTQSAINACKVVLGLNLPVFAIPSGGTNSKTLKLAEQQKVSIDGVAFGSYARKIVSDFIYHDDFWENRRLFELAVKRIQAERLV